MERTTGVGVEIGPMLREMRRELMAVDGAGGREEEEEEFSED